jgi:hypothetical protein
VVLHHEVVLHEEEPVVDKRVFPRERLRLENDTVTDETQVAEEIRCEGRQRVRVQRMSRAWTSGGLHGVLSRQAPLCLDSSPGPSSAVAVVASRHERGIDADRHDVVTRR